MKWFQKTNDAKQLEKDTLSPSDQDPDKIKPEDVISKPGDSVSDDEDLEIPAFIRRKMM